MKEDVWERKRYQVSLTCHPRVDDKKTDRATRYQVSAMCHPRSSSRRGGSRAREEAGLGILAFETAPAAEQESLSLFVTGKKSGPS
ncbi:hypothetical protein E2562_019675 [Oryza meyeriana var. granulata]|uniref:Uncharacterized protein n=1 Tax=Oryza meyeriana var. granulata TaxID=110450 RepID=A0A6G1C7T5_9ORYZ|nr:hypothetical protein E2562_019675 [Oryza meyeriana var. granulata]